MQYSLYGKFMASDPEVVLNRLSTSEEKVLSSMKTYIQYTLLGWIYCLVGLSFVQPSEKRRVIFEVLDSLSVIP